MQRIFVFSPEPAAPSETFIRAHLQNLPFNIVPIYRWRAPYQTPCGLIARFPGYLRALSERIYLPLLPGLFGYWATRQAAKWLRSIRPALVLAEYGPVGANIVDACGYSDTPLIVFFHGFDAYQRATIDRHRSGYRKVFDQAAAIVVPSLAMREQLVSLGAQPSSIVINPYGVDPDLFVESKPGLNGPLFLSVGRFVGKKGPLHTIRAFAQVHQAMPECRLSMIGTGPLLESSQALAAELGLSHAITFLGACTHSTVQAYMQQARAVVQHSMRCESGDQEGTPVALIEAQMAGVPVVATMHAGIPSVVLNGRTGFLVAEGDVDGMAEAMLKLGQDSRLAAELGFAARTHALQQHTMARHINALAATIQEVIKHHNLEARS